ncbi:hypothetical protein [Flagellimonas crocea]|uniref:hypothetical protein n=1 Tax=Flagellimonas crocea TaxID=3067311 RepID=UPI00296E52FA|nr:hypothetical protein [Muricauda sp. DH64]
MKKSSFLFTALVTSILVSKIFEYPDTRTTKKREGQMAVSTSGREGHNFKIPAMESETEQSIQFRIVPYGVSDTPQVNSELHYALDQSLVPIKIFGPK